MKKKHLSETLAVSANVIVAAQCALCWAQTAVSLFLSLTQLTIPSAFTFSLALSPAHRPDSGADEFLLSTEFLDKCYGKYSLSTVPSVGPRRVFAPKFLNIIDPLLDANNLGRSVGKGGVAGGKE